MTDLKGQREKLGGWGWEKIILVGSDHDQVLTLSPAGVKGPFWSNRTKGSHCNPGRGGRGLALYWKQRDRAKSTGRHA